MMSKNLRHPVLFGWTLNDLLVKKNKEEERVINLKSISIEGPLFLSCEWRLSVRLRYILIQVICRCGRQRAACSVLLVCDSSLRPCNRPKAQLSLCSVAQWLPRTHGAKSPRQE